jgi:hypothetical protein
METTNGRIEKVMGRSKIKAVDMGRNSSNYHNRRFLWGLILVSTLSIAGCSLGKIKSGLITGAATSAVVGATSVLPGGVIVPTVAAGLTAATASALTAESPVKGEPIAVTADTVVQEAPDNFFSLIGSLVEMGGWLLGLVLLVPMVLGWIIPGPLTTHKKKK